LFYGRSAIARILFSAARGVLFLADMKTKARDSGTRREHKLSSFIHSVSPGKLFGLYGSSSGGGGVGPLESEGCSQSYVAQCDADEFGFDCPAGITPSSTSYTCWSVAPNTYCCVESESSCESCDGGSDADASDADSVDAGDE
jgi:hypothetical protein